MDKLVLDTELLRSVLERPTVWWRDIDDVFAIWPYGEESLQVLLNELNLFHPIIKFTAEIDLYTKPTVPPPTAKRVSPAVKPFD